MGMFDYLEVEIPLLNEDHNQLTGWQTKSLVNLLDKFKITEEGLFVVDSNWLKNGALFPITGPISFHTMDGDEFVEYQILFDEECKPILNSIVLIN